MWCVNHTLLKMVTHRLPDSAIPDVRPGMDILVGDPMPGYARLDLRALPAWTRTRVESFCEFAREYESRKQVSFSPIDELAHDLPQEKTIQLDTVYCLDALELLKKLSDDSVDLVWIDPPYGNNNGIDDLAAARAADKVKGGRQTGTIMAIANDSNEEWERLMPPVLKEINRILKPTGCCCCCCCGGGPNVQFARLANWIDEFHGFYQALVWDKSARGWGMGWRYRRNYEFVMVSHKKGGRLAWNDERPATPNILYYRPSDNSYHPTEKPLEMVQDFILNHTKPGDLVVDCFAGGGTTAVAAKRLGRRFIVGDLELRHVSTIQARLAQPYTPDMFTAPLFDTAPLAEQQPLFDS